MSITVVMALIGHVISGPGSAHYMREDERRTLCGLKPSLVFRGRMPWPVPPSERTCPKCLKAGGKRFAKGK